MRVEPGHGGIVVREPLGVGHRLLERLGRQQLQHPDRVVRGDSPQRIVELSEYLPRGRRPAPPQIASQRLEALDAFRKYGQGRWSPSTVRRDSMRGKCGGRGPSIALAAPHAKSHASTVAMRGPMVYAEDAAWPETLDQPPRNANERKRSSSGASRRPRVVWMRKTGSRRQDRRERTAIRILPTSSLGHSRPQTGSSTRVRASAGAYPHSHISRSSSSSTPVSSQAEPSPGAARARGDGRRPEPGNHDASRFQFAAKQYNSPAPPVATRFGLAAAARTVRRVPRGVAAADTIVVTEHHAALAVAVARVVAAGRVHVTCDRAPVESEPVRMSCWFGMSPTPFTGAALLVRARTSC